MNPDADARLDCFGLLCPMPIVKTAERMKTLPVGQILEIIATDSGIKEDIANWCKSTGQELVGFIEEGKEYRAYVRRLR